MDDFWKIAAFITVGTVAYLSGKSNGETQVTEKFIRDREIAELRNQIALLKKQRITDETS